MKSMLVPPKTIAIVGLSDKPERASYQVAAYLLEKGFTIIPVNPMIKEIFSLPSYPSITAIPDNIHIDIIDIFRAPEQVVPILKEIVHSKRKPLIWLQEGVGSPEAKSYATAHQLPIRMDICIMKQHKNQ